MLVAISSVLVVISNILVSISIVLVVISNVLVSISIVLVMISSLLVVISIFKASFLSWLQRNGFMPPVYLDVCLLSPFDVRCLTVELTGVRKQSDVTLLHAGVERIVGRSRYAE